VELTFFEHWFADSLTFLNLVFKTNLKLKTKCIMSDTVIFCDNEPKTVLGFGFVLVLSQILLFYVLDVCLVLF